MDKLHFIQRKDEYFIYIPNSYDIVKVNRLTYTVIQKIVSGQSRGEICKTYHIGNDEVERMETYFNDLSSKLPSCTQDVRFENNSKVIDRITLHVSNDCNLRCKYCYASGGNYLAEKKLMSKKTAEAFVDFCINEFSEVRHIVFFGGEPFLNPSIILYICQTFESKYYNKEIKFLPKFGAITNGTIMTPLIMEIIRTHFHFLTVSIDGPQRINDINRVDIRGNGTFNRIYDFINEVRKIPNIDVQYESTFTEMHLQMGYTHDSIRQFMSETFHIHGNVLNEYNMEKNSLIGEEYFYDADDIVNHKYPEGFWSIIQALATKRPKTMCQIYWRNFSVSVNGDIYPCHMNTEIKRCCLGNVRTQNAYTSPQQFLPVHPGIAKGLKNNKICNECWANNLCGGCSRLWFYNENCSNYSAQPNLSICEKNNRHIENILVAIYNLKADPSKWHSFSSEHFHKSNLNTLYNE